MKRRVIHSLESLAPAAATRARAYKAYFYGEPEIRLLRHLVAPDKAAVDVGANNGVYTFWLRRYALRVIALDPNPDCCSLLSRSFDDRVHVVNAACSDRAGSAELRIPCKDGNINAYRGSIDTGVDFNSETLGIQVATTPLDALVEEPVGFIKIDVEGHEVSVLSGARTVFGNQRPVALVEAEERHKPGTVESVLAYFHQLAYAGFFLYEKQILPVDVFDPDRHQSEAVAGSGARPPGYANNFIFIPQENRAAMEILSLSKRFPSPFP